MVLECFPFPLSPVVAGGCVPPAQRSKQRSKDQENGPGRHRGSPGSQGRGPGILLGSRYGDSEPTRDNRRRQEWLFRERIKRTPDMSECPERRHRYVTRNLELNYIRTLKDYNLKRQLLKFQLKPMMTQERI